jgi:phosphatidylserine decarboxylase
MAVPRLHFAGFSLTVATFAAAQLLRIVPRVRLSRAVGRLCEQPLPAPLSRLVSTTYARAYRVNLEEAEPRDEEYPSFDAFFTRRLKAGARPIASSRVTSPADGNIVAVGDVIDGGTIRVKGQHYPIGELIGSPQEAERYVGGEFAVVYLHPRDYHRVHSPVDGTLTTVRVLPGDLFPVNSIGERHIPRLFVRNRRVAMALDTETVGHVQVVMVGATIVGKISVAALGERSGEPGTHDLKAGVALKRGDELGAFHLGSTVVILFERAQLISRATGPVFMGESLERT